MNEALSIYFEIMREAAIGLSRVMLRCKTAWHRHFVAKP